MFELTKKAEDISNKAVDICKELGGVEQCNNITTLLIIGVMKLKKSVSFLEESRWQNNAAPQDFLKALNDVEFYADCLKKAKLVNADQIALLQQDCADLRNALKGFT